MGPRVRLANASLGKSILATILALASIQRRNHARPGLVRILSGSTMASRPAGAEQLQAALNEQLVRGHRPSAGRGDGLTSNLKLR